MVFLYVYCSFMGKYCGLKEAPTNVSASFTILNCPSYLWKLFLGPLCIKSHVLGRSLRSSIHRVPTVLQQNSRSHLSINNRLRVILTTRRLPQMPQTPLFRLLVHWCHSPRYHHFPRHQLHPEIPSFIVTSLFSLSHKGRQTFCLCKAFPHTQYPLCLLRFAHPS